jgi:hypothetical protein
MLVKANMGNSPLFTSTPMKDKHLKTLKMNDIFCNIKTLRTSTSLGLSAEGTTPKKGVCWDWNNKRDRIFVHQYCVLHVFHAMDVEKGVGWVNGADKFVEFFDGYMTFKEDVNYVDVMDKSS